MTPAKTIKSRLAFEQAVKAILESYAGEPISFPKCVWPVQFEKVAKQITKLHMSELANLLVEAKARTTHAGEHMMLSQLAKEVSRKKRPAPSLGSRLAKAAKPQCHHEGDKSDFHPQFCRKCGEEFAYVHTIPITSFPRQMRDLEKRLEHLRDLGGLANLNDYVEARRQYSLHNIAPPHNVKTCRVCQLAKEVL